MARVDMDLKALDLAAESIRHGSSVGGGILDGPASSSSSAESPSGNSFAGGNNKPQSVSQPVSPAKSQGEQVMVPGTSEPMNNCDIEKVLFFSFSWKERLSVSIIPSPHPVINQSLYEHKISEGIFNLSISNSNKIPADCGD